MELVLNPELLLKLGLATGIGATVGLERELDGNEACRKKMRN
ncbi:MAG: hypothetical protein NUV67_04860 [archaeon]|nr:hypothetical protein [archaeon]